MVLTPSTTPTMASPYTPINPEDSAFLQAIEAIEAQGINPDPKPYDPASLSTRAPHSTPVNSPGPQVIEPILAAQPKPRPQPTPILRSPLTVPSPSQPRPIPTAPQPRPVPVQLKPVVAPQPRPLPPTTNAVPAPPPTPAVKHPKPLTIAQAIIEELKNNPFPKLLHSHKHVGAIVTITFLLVIIGAGSYFFLFLQ
jgi:hypothetical protein